MNFLIEGKPISQCRPRFFRGRVYDPLSSIKKQMQKKLRCTIADLGPRMPPDRALCLEACVYTKIPDSFSKAKQKRLEGTWDIGTPDVDNFAKFLMDVMTEIVYEDDRFISKLCIEKKKSSVPRVEINIYQLGVSDE